MAVVDAFLNNVLPYPIFGLPYTFVFPILDADGDLVTGAASDTPDTELSKDGDTFTDRTELVELGSSGMYYVSLTAAEMTCSIGSLIFKTATAGTKTTPIVFYPRVLVQCKSGTATAGAAGTITLQAGSSEHEDYYNGAIIYIHTGTGNGQVRTITDYNGTTLVASVTPDFTTNPSSDSEYYIYLTDTFPNTAIQDETLANVESIELTGSSLNQIAESNTLTTGTQSSGTYANTATEDGVYHVITAASNEIDIYYEFDIGEFGIPVATHIWGYLKEGAPKGGDTIDLYAYNWGGTAFEVVHFDAFIGITTDDPHEVSATLLNRHVGTGTDEGKVRIRFQATSLEAGTTLNIDEIIISYAEALGANIDAILADVTGINGAAMRGTDSVVLAGPTKAEMDAALLVMKQKATGTYNRETDSLEALRDRGDAAWITGGGGAAPTAAQVADAVWDEDITGHETADTAGRVQSAKMGDWELTSDNQMVCKGLSGNVLFTFDLTQNGTPTRFNPYKRETA